MNLPIQQESNSRKNVKNRTSNTTEAIQSRKSLPKAKQQNIDQMQKAAVEIRFLARSWLDDFEKEVFDGKTVDELLNKGVYE